MSLNKTEATALQECVSALQDVVKSLALIQEKLITQNLNNSGSIYENSKQTRGYSPNETYFTPAKSFQGIDRSLSQPSPSAGNKSSMKFYSLQNMKDVVDYLPKSALPENAFAPTPKRATINLSQTQPTQNVPSNQYKSNLDFNTSIPSKRQCLQNAYNSPENIRESQSASDISNSNENRTLYHRTRSVDSKGVQKTISIRKNPDGSISKIYALRKTVYPENAILSSPKIVYSNNVSENAGNERSSPKKVCCFVNSVTNEKLNDYNEDLEATADNEASKTYDGLQKFVDDERKRIDNFQDILNLTNKPKFKRPTGPIPIPKHTSPSTLENNRTQNPLTENETNEILNEMVDAVIKGFEKIIKSLDDCCKLVLNNCLTMFTTQEQNEATTNHFKSQIIQTEMKMNELKRDLSETISKIMGVLTRRTELFAPELKGLKDFVEGEHASTNVPVIETEDISPESNEKKAITSSIPTVSVPNKSNDGNFTFMPTLSSTVIPAPKEQEQQKSNENVPDLKETDEEDIKNKEPKL